MSPEEGFYLCLHTCPHTYMMDGEGRDEGEVSATCVPCEYIRPRRGKSFTMVGGPHPLAAAPVLALFRAAVPFLGTNYL